MYDIKIDMLPALAGDSFLVTINSEHRTNILIDCGYIETYTDYLKNKLRDINNSKEVIDLLVISHIDADHISGALEFLKENNSLLGKEDFININEIWHNSLRHVYSKDRKKDTIEKNDKDILESIRIKGIPAPSDSVTRRGKNISAIQGSTLSGLIVKGNYNWNSASNHNAISIENITQPYNINETRVVLLSPNTERLLGLEKEWKKQLIRNKNFKGKITEDETFDDVFEILLGQTFDKKLRQRNMLISGEKNLKSYSSKEEQLDDSAINCSSISFVLEYKDKKVLFLGDSNPSDICEEIKKVYKWDKCNRIFFDAIKISHHGSNSNTSNELLEVIDSDKFIISTNGNKKYNHPDVETIAKIVCRNAGFTRELIFNYKNNVERFNDIEWMSSYNYKIRNIEDKEIQEIYI